MDLANFAGSRKFFFRDDTTGLATGQQFTVAIQQDSQGPLRVTMAYTDAPGTAAAERVLVNDLDLSVTDSSGHVYFPNHGSGKDAVNNMEQIDLPTAAVGSYTVKVVGANVPQGKNGAQPFGLVVSQGN